MKNTFYDEIMTQPLVLRETFQEYTKNDNEKLIEIAKYIKIRLMQTAEQNRIPIKKINFLGIGTSYFASLIAENYLNQIVFPVGSKIDCRAIDAGEFLYHYTLNRSDEDTLIILVSQSGESGEILQIIDKLQRNNFPKENIWGITNTESSTIHKTADLTLLLYAGEEKSVTNKTYLCSLLVINILSKLIEISINPGELKDKIDNLVQSLRKELDILISDIDDILNNWDSISTLFANFLKIDSKIYPRFINFISRGTGLATTGQAALNLKEVAKIYAESISAAMFRHGPIEIIDDKFRAVFISNSDNDRDSITKLIQNVSLKWGSGKIILITNSKEQTLKFDNNPNVLVLFHMTKDRFLTPIYEIVPIQVIFYKLAELNRIAPGTFRYSSKVTKEF